MFFSMYKLINNEIQAVEDSSLNARAAKYGDGFFETISASEKNLFLFDYHYERIIKSFRYLYFTEDSLPSEHQLESFLRQQLQANLFKKSRINLQFFRDASGYYTPSSNQAAFTTSIVDLTPTVQQQETYTIGIYTENKKYANPLSEIKSSNALISVLAATWKAMTGIDDAILLNAEGNICEATASNIFIVKNNKIYTPPLRDAPIDGVMRRYLIECLLEKDIPIIEKSLKDNELFEADEVFLSNTISKIQSVTSFGELIKYGTAFTKEIKELLDIEA